MLFLLFNLFLFNCNIYGEKKITPTDITSSDMFFLKNYVLLVFNNYIISLKAKDFFEEGDLESIYWYLSIRNGNMDNQILLMLIRYRDLILSNYKDMKKISISQNLEILHKIDAKILETIDYQGYEQFLIIKDAFLLENNYINYI